MPMTRQRAQSSFTVEIKRATRRTPEVLTLAKTSSLRRSSLADQVFSKVSGRPLSADFGGPEDPASVQQTPSVSLTSPEVHKPEPQTQPRRVLPDLLSVPVDPVAERIKQEAEERASRYRAARKVRTRESPATRAARPMSKTSALAPVTAEAVAEARTVAQSTQQGLPSPRRKWNVLAAKARRAEREGQPLPRLPAGQRWKRRLPKACW
jgi:hypothetical protein